MSIDLIKVAMEMSKNFTDKSIFENWFKAEKGRPHECEKMNNGPLAYRPHQLHGGRCQSSKLASPLGIDSRNCLRPSKLNKTELITTAMFYRILGPSGLTKLFWECINSQ